MIMKFPSEIYNTVVTYKFTDEEKAAVKKGETLLFVFDIRSDISTPIKITVNVGTVINDEDGSMTMEYFVPVQLSRIYMPVKNNGMVSVSVETEGVVYLQNAGYINQGSTPISNLQLKSGMWLLDAPEQTSVDNSYGIGAGKTIDLIKKGNFIYSIGNGAFTVTDAEQKKTLGKIDGFGTLRQMDITDDGKHAVITGRQDGVYIIN